MSESTLAVTYDDLRSELGYKAGYGRTVSRWDTNQSADAESMLKSVIRLVCLPQATQHRRAGYRWSFLEPTATLDVWASIVVGTDTVTGGAYASGSTPITASAASFYPSMIGAEIVITGVDTFTIDGYTSSTVISVTGDASTASADTFSIATTGLYRLPDDFVCMIGSFSYPRNSSTLATDIPLVSEAIVRDLHQNVSATGRITNIATRPVKSTGASGQRWETYVYPIPDTLYSLPYKYSMMPDAMTSSIPYPPGGAILGDLYIQACYAVFEKRHLRGENEEQITFASMLEAAIAMDERNSTPETLGHMSGDSAYPHRHGDYPEIWVNSTQIQ